MQPQFEATRRSLLDRLKDWGDQGSWNDFFSTYWKLIYGTALKSGLNETEAQDAVQDTIVAVCKSIKEFQYNPDRCSFKSWLLMITRQRIIWQLRKRTPQSASDFQAVEPATGTSTTDRLPDPAASLKLDAIWEEEWQTNLMNAALDSIKREVTPRQFQMFDLYVLQNWPMGEVTRTLNVNAGQVYLAKHRISRLLKLQVARLEAAADNTQPARGK